MAFDKERYAADPEFRGQGDLAEMVPREDGVTQEVPTELAVRVFLLGGGQ